MKITKNMFIQKDWKWLAGIILSLFAIVIPSWISLSQNDSKSIGISVISVTPIVDKTASDIEDIIVMSGNVKIVKPYLSTISISNSENKN